jgi:hypothetical protein
VTRTQRRIEEFRKGEACIQVLEPAGQCGAGIAVSVEQESHAFPFGCVVPNLNVLSESNRKRYRTRLNEVFNCFVSAEMLLLCDPKAIRVVVGDRIHLGRLCVRLDELSAGGRMLHVYVGGNAVGMTDVNSSERETGKRAAELYALCFGHPLVAGVYWNGFSDTETATGLCGLLRRDLAPKYAYKAIQKMIGIDWHTRASGKTDAEGQFRFRGFFGDYRVVANASEGNAVVGNFTLAPSGDPIARPAAVSAFRFWVPVESARLVKNSGR